jgi:hypothetical protein
MLYLYAVLAARAVFGPITALIADSEGRSFFKWWVYGFFLFLPALIHSFVLRPYVPCPHCGEPIEEALMMYHIYTVHQWSRGGAVSPPEPVRYSIPYNTQSF